MKYNININQKAIIDNGFDLNINDAVLLDFFKDFCRTENEKLDKIEFRNELYFWVNYAKVLEEMPLLTFKSERQLSRKLKSLEKRGFLKRKIKKEWAKTKVYIALKPNIYALNFSFQKSHPTKCPDTPDKSVILHPTPMSCNHNIIDNIIIDNTIGIRDLTLKVLALWNDRPTGAGFPQNVFNRPALIKLLPQCRKITPDIEKVFSGLKDYTEEDFKKAILNYCVEVLGRNPANDYSKHRFSFYEFFKQKNGFLKFLHK